MIAGVMINKSLATSYGGIMTNDNAANAFMSPHTGFSLNRQDVIFHNSFILWLNQNFIFIEAMKKLHKYSSTRDHVGEIPCYCNYWYCLSSCMTNLHALAVLYTYKFVRRLHMCWFSVTKLNICTKMKSRKMSWGAILISFIIYFYFSIATSGVFKGNWGQAKLHVSRTVMFHVPQSCQYCDH